MNYKQEIGVRFKEIREKLGMNQSEFSEALSMSHQTTSGKIERGESTPTIPMLKEASRLTGISIDYILKGGESFQLGKATQMNMSMQTEAAKEAMQSLNRCAKSIKKLDMSVVLGIKYYENELKKVPRDPETEKAINIIRMEGAVAN